MSTFPHFNPLQGTRLGTPSYLGRSLYEAEGQQKLGHSDNLYPLHKANAQHGNHAQTVGCKACATGQCSGGDVSNPCPAGQHK